jgi:TetR/AcrR family transcriptional regulator, mexJK operon transcriptional repressor
LKPTGIIYRPRVEETSPEGQRTAGRPTRHAAAALSGHILDTAQNLFLTQGFEATSLNQIAVAANATKRTLYVKVGNKEELFAAVVRRMLSQRHQRLINIQTAGSSKSRLISFGDNMLKFALDPDVLRLHRLMVAEAPRFPALAGLMEEQITYGSRAYLAELLRDEIRRGRLTLTNPETAAKFLLSMFIGEPQRAALFGLEPWTSLRCKNWVRAAVNQFHKGSQKLPIETKHATTNVKS